MLAVMLLYSAVDRARADTISENDPSYREHVQAALAAYDAGDLVRAHARFEQAYARYPNARALRGLGTVELEQKEYVSAATHLEQALASSELPLQGPLREDTEDALSEAYAHVGRVLVLASPANAELQLDDRRVRPGSSVVLAPGVYTIALSAPGYRSESRQVMVSKGQNQLIHWSLEHVALVPIAPPTRVEVPPAREELAPWLAIGAGSAVAMTGIALLAVGIRDYRQLDDANAYADWQNRRDRYPKLAGIGGVLAGVGTLTVATSWWWRGHSRQSLGVSLGAAPLSLRTSF